MASQAESVENTSRMGSPAENPSNPMALPRLRPSAAMDWTNVFLAGVWIVSVMVSGRLR